MSEKRIVFIGAHPDDADILCGGTAVKLAKIGHKVKFVSAANGDTGHFRLSRAETAKVRQQEKKSLMHQNSMPKNANNTCSNGTNVSELPKSLNNLHTALLMP